jgi:hypothetical protein
MFRTPNAVLVFLTLAAIFGLALYNVDSVPICERTFFTDWAEANSIMAAGTCILVAAVMITVSIGSKYFPLEDNN